MNSQEDQFITVPEVTLPCGIVIPPFNVGKYACSKSDEGKAIIASDRKPWVRINYFDAIAACEKAGFQMITELQWLAIAYDASQQDCNWTGGKVGEGDLFTGIRNGHVNSAQAGDYIPTDETERRVLTLSNGSQIYDINGNIYQWVFDNVQGDERGIIARDFAKDSPSITTPPYPSCTKGMGDYEVWDWSGRALLRGGFWRDSHSGVFRLGDDWPNLAYGDIGFRCTKKASA